jgi:Fur family peroxide stress response transcriptional regulator
MNSEPFRSLDDGASAARQRAEKLQAAGLKVTAPRLAVMEYLESNSTHPSAERLFADLRERHPSLSLSTVYKTLEAFLRAGVCRRIAGEGMRLRVDGTLHPHDHAVCRSCGRIFDVAAALYPRSRPPTQLPGGLAVTGVRVEYEVICSACAIRAQSRAAVGSRNKKNRPEGLRAGVRATNSTNKEA